jgi:hypothetical protein
VLAEALARLEYAVAGAVEVGAPGGVLATAAHALGPAGASLALALAAHGVQRGVGAAHEMEVVADDPRVGERRADRLR